ncbi:MAG: hypothetical protein FWH55_13440 [Oscillospiraceae bacterium]|nr:hypothetical protein [Oscillospiraceae bacterium]
MGYQYFRSRLSDQEQIVYDKIYNALVSYKSGVTLLGLANSNQVDRIAQFVIQENPSIFYTSGFQLQVGLGFTEVTPQYIMGQTEAQKLAAECERIAKRVLPPFSIQSTYDRAVYVHDTIIRSVDYKNDGTISAHSILSPFLSKYGVCDGFAKVFKFMLDLLHIPSIVVSGQAKSYAQSDYGPHAWNMIEIDKQWTHVDVTFDSTIGSKHLIRHDYFGLPVRDISLDHTFAEGMYPVAFTNGMEYYQRNGLVMSTRAALESHAMQQLSSTNRELIFKLPQNVQSGGLDTKVLSVVAECCKKLGINGSIQMSFNSIQKVYHVTIK